MGQLDYSEIDGIFRSVNRVLWIVTAASKQSRSGLVATWVNQSSIDPQTPLALVGLASNHFTAQLADASKAVCLHLIDRSHIDLAWRFGLASGRTQDKFAGIKTETAVTGAPVLIDCLSWLDCRVLTRYDAGDRSYFWVDVVAGGRRAAGTPLTEQELLAAADDTQRQALTASMAADRVAHRPLQEAWRRRIAAPQGNA